MTNKAFNSIFIAYSNFANIFYSKLAFELIKYIKNNNYIIKLVNKQ